MSTANWELSKENTQPLKRGRDPQKLRSFMSNAEKLRSISKNAGDREEFERQIEAARRDDSSNEDPLAIWIKYIRWLQETYPSGTTYCDETGEKPGELLQLLERCCLEFQYDERYRNNEKYLKVWIAKADMLENPTEVFKYLRDNGIGDKVTLYYVATAWTAERRGDYSLAEKAYKVGIEKEAQPIELLKKRYREFMRRMTRKLIDGASSDQGDGTNSSVANPQRQREFQEISRREARSFHRPLVNERRTRVHANISGRGESEPRSENVQNEPKPAFEIFEDRAATGKANNWGGESTSRESASDKFAAQGMLHGMAEKSKENSLKAGPWSNQALGMSKRAGNVDRGADPKVQKFKIFEDTADEGFPQANHTTKDTSGILKVREKRSDVELLMKKPLQNFATKEVKATPKIEKCKEESQEKNIQQSAVASLLVEANKDDVTINTRLARDDMFELFGSPSMKTTLAAQSNKGSTPFSQRSQCVPKSRGFSVFNDASSEKPKISRSEIRNNSEGTITTDTDDEFDADDQTASSKLFSVIFSDDSPPKSSKRTSKAAGNEFGSDIESKYSRQERRNRNSHGFLHLDNNSRNSRGSFKGLHLDEGDETLDTSFSFAPLEAILEASSEIEDSINSSSLSQGKKDYHRFSSDRE